MHNCKATRSEFIERAFDEIAPAQRERLLIELQQCAACREEYAVLRNVLRAANQGFRSALPTESFWPSYHARLRRRLEDVSAVGAEGVLYGPSMFARLWMMLKQIATSSVRVPVPVGAVLLLFLGLATLFALYSRSAVSDGGTRESISVMTKTVEVPVVQERVVTRVVYVERNPRRVRGSQEQLASSGSPDKATVTLVGFKPTEQIKLTVIKGSYQDEK